MSEPPAAEYLEGVHPARLMRYDELAARLADARARRLVYERRSADGLLLYIYSERCVYDRAWDQTTLMARGLILDPSSQRVVATPFPKFFNLGERDEPIPALPFETAEKLDGSLIVVFHHGGRWRTATKGAFDSSQALWAQVRLDRQDLSALEPGTTYLAEATYPENRIIVRYEDPALVLLAAFAEDGREITTASLALIAERLGWPMAARHSFASISELISCGETLPRDQEGFVVRFSDGQRLKIKGNEYRRLHALISRVTPLAIWEVLTRGESLADFRKDLPEEFWSDFDGIVHALEQAKASLISRVSALADAVRELSDKDLGLRLGQIDPELRGFLFTFRKSRGDMLGNERARQSILRAIRPAGNALAGYHPSYAINRIIDETG